MDAGEVNQFEAIGPSAQGDGASAPGHAPTYIGAASDSARPQAQMAGPDSSSAVATLSTRRAKPPKLYRIGEVVDYSGMSRQTIHNYTTMGLLHESKWTTGGHRLYDESVFERLDAIAQLKDQNKSLEDIRDYFLREEMV